MNRRTALSLALLNSFVPAVAFGLGPVGPEFLANSQTSGSQLFADVAAAADGSFVMVWSAAGDVFVRRFSPRGSALGKEVLVGETTSIQSTPSVAVNANGDFTVVWQVTEGGFGEIYARPFQADGTPKRDQFRVNQYTSGHQGEPRVAMNAAGAFVVTWYSDHDDPPEQLADIAARCYNADGGPRTKEFRVNAVTTGDVWSPAIAMSAAGDFVVTWTDPRGGEEDSNVRARRFDASCARLGNEFVVDGGLGEGEWQDSSSVAMDVDGDFVVAWLTWPPVEGPPVTVEARRYRADGAPRGDAFQVNKYTAARQHSPRVAMDAFGNFVVAWASDGQEDGDDGNTGVYARRFLANGSSLDSLFRVNQTTTLDQRSPTVALDADGDLIVAWDHETSPYSFDIFARRFEAFASVDVSLNQIDTPDPVMAGETLTYTLKVRNLNAAVTPTGRETVDQAIGAASNVRIVSHVPAGSSNVTARGQGWTCSVDGEVVDCRYKYLLRAADGAPTVTVQLTAPSTLEPTVSMDSRVKADQPDPQGGNNRRISTTAVNN